MKTSPAKQIILQTFRDHVSSGKAAFFEKYGMDFIPGKREGSYLYDLDGKKRLFNLHCNGGVFNLGHRNSELTDLLKSSLDKVDIGNHHLISRERAELAEILAQLMPEDLNYTVFGVSGGEAVDLAIKVARGYSGRTRIISAVKSYHGHTGLALAAGEEEFRAPFGPPAPGFVQVPFGDVEAIKESINDDTAAVLLETIPATAGILIPPPDYLGEVRALCDQRGALLILDEVQTGLGRTGKLWGFEHFDVIPDIVVLGKGLSGGIYPLTATVLREPLDKVFRSNPFIHVSTFGGAEVGCRVAKRVLEISSSQEFLDGVNQLAEAFRSGVEELHQKHPRFLTGFRQLGLMMGLVLKDDLSGPLLTKSAYDADLLLVYAHNDPRVCQCLPPLVMEPEKVAWVLERLDTALGTARRIQPVVKITSGLKKAWGKLKGRESSR